MARFSACRSTFSTRRGCDIALTRQMSERMSRASSFKQRRQIAIGVPGARHGLLVNLGCAKEIAHVRDVDERAIVADVALALLLGVVEGMGVQERPDELAADVFEAKLEVRVLIDGVVAGVERGGADGGALLFGDLLRTDQARSVAGARGGDGRVEGLREGVAQRDARRRLFDHRRRQRLPRLGWLRGARRRRDGRGHARNPSLHSGTGGE